MPFPSEPKEIFQIRHDKVAVNILTYSPMNCQTNRLVFSETWFKPSFILWLFTKTHTLTHRRLYKGHCFVPQGLLSLFTFYHCISWPLQQLLIGQFWPAGSGIKPSWLQVFHWTWQDQKGEGGDQRGAKWGVLVDMVRVCGGFIEFAKNPPSLHSSSDSAGEWQACAVREAPGDSHAAARHSNAWLFQQKAPWGQK